jgi:hypothetical protein
MRFLQEISKNLSGNLKIEIPSYEQILGDCQNLSKRLRPDLDQSKPGLNLV